MRYPRLKGVPMPWWGRKTGTGFGCDQLRNGRLRSRCNSEGEMRACSQESWERGKRADFDLVGWESRVTDDLEVSALDNLIIGSFVERSLASSWVCSFFLNFLGRCFSHKWVWHCSCGTCSREETYHAMKEISLGQEGQGTHFLLRRAGSCTMTMSLLVGDFWKGQWADLSNGEPYKGLS